MSEQAVEVRGLRVRRGRADVFAGLDLDIPRGTITGLLSPSGWGKTRLMRSIVGVQQVAAGTVTVLGAPAGSPALRRRVAYGTQGSSVYGDLTVRQNLRYFARLLGAPRGDVDRALEQVGLTAQADRLVGSLSGGQENRVSLAVALLGTPEVPLIVFPQIILGGLFMPRDQMPDVLHAVSDWLPLSYAIDAVAAVAAGDDGWDLWRPMLVVAAFTAGALVLASLTLRRRTP